MLHAELGARFVSRRFRSSALTKAACPSCESTLPLSISACVYWANVVVKESERIAMMLRQPLKLAMVDVIVVSTRLLARYYSWSSLELPIIYSKESRWSSSQRPTQECSSDPTSSDVIDRTLHDAKTCPI
jgi:hypothetical protein